MSEFEGDADSGEMLIGIRTAGLVRVDDGDGGWIAADLIGKVMSVTITSSL